MKLQIQFHLARTQAAWPSRDAVLKAEGQTGQAYPGNRYLYGKTVGLLVSPFSEYGDRCCM
jgi:hypothetical protein